MNESMNESMRRMFSYMMRRVNVKGGRVMRYIQIFELFQALKTVSCGTSTRHTSKVTQKKENSDLIAHNIIETDAIATQIFYVNGREICFFVVLE
jgi:hypothetical protein